MRIPTATTFQRLARLLTGEQGQQVAIVINGIPHPLSTEQQKTLKYLLKTEPTLKKGVWCSRRQTWLGRDVDPVGPDATT